MTKLVIISVTKYRLVYFNKSSYIIHKRLIYFDNMANMAKSSDTSHNFCYQIEMCLFQQYGQELPY